MIETGDGQKFDEDKRYSGKDLAGHDLTGSKDMSGIVIARSCFSREAPDSDVFPPAMTGTTFVDCNLENCKLPPGNFLVNCSTRRFAVQTDGHDWEVDAKGVPLRRLNEAVFLKKGLPPPDPADLPAEKLDVPVDDFVPPPLVLVEVPAEKALAFDAFLTQEGLKKGGGR